MNYFYSSCRCTRPLSQNLDYKTLQTVSFTLTIFYFRFNALLVCILTIRYVLANISIHRNACLCVAYVAHFDNLWVAPSRRIFIFHIWMNGISENTAAETNLLQLDLEFPRARVRYALLNCSMNMRNIIVWGPRRR